MSTMRETTAYDVQNDCFAVRFDILIKGVGIEVVTYGDIQPWQMADPAYRQILVDKATEEFKKRLVFKEFSINDLLELPTNVIGCKATLFPLVV